MEGIISYIKFVYGLSASINENAKTITLKYANKEHRSNTEFMFYFASGYIKAKLPDYSIQTIKEK